MYTIEIRSRHKDLWRYNLILSCGGMDADGELLYVDGTKRVESELFYPKTNAKPLRPKNFIVNDPLTLKCDEAESLRILIYIIPYIFPDETRIDQCEPFVLNVEIRRLDEVIYREKHKINSWSGASLDFKIKTNEDSEI